MKLFTWFEQYDWVMQLLMFAVILYFYFKNRNKKVDEEKVHWYRVTGMAFIVFTLVSSCVIAIIVHDDPSKFSQIAQPVIWSTIVLYTIVCLYIGYRFRRSENLATNHFEPSEELKS